MTKEQLNRASILQALINHANDTTISLNTSEVPEHYDKDGEKYYRQHPVISKNDWNSVKAFFREKINHNIAAWQAELDAL
jgi:hypothetical protein